MLQLSKLNWKKLFFWNLIDIKKRHEAFNAVPIKDFLLKNTLSILISAFLLFTPVILVGNVFIMYYLYKSIWTIFIGVVLVYLLVLFFAIEDFILVKWVAPELLEDKMNYIKFYNIVAVLFSVSLTIYLIVEVL